MKCSLEENTVMVPGIILILYTCYWHRCSTNPVRSGAGPLRIAESVLPAEYVPAPGGEGERDSLGSFYYSFQGSAVRLPSHIARAMPTSLRTIHLNIYFNK